MVTRINNQWLCTDYCDPSDEYHWFPEIEITSDVHLRKVLESFVDQSSRIIVFSSRQGYLVSMGIGGPFAKIEYRATVDTSIPLVAHPEEPCTDHDVGFGYQGHSPTGTPVDLFPVEEAIEIVLDIFRTDRLPDRAKWSLWQGRR